MGTSDNKKVNEEQARDDKVPAGLTLIELKLVIHTICEGEMEGGWWGWGSGAESGQPWKCPNPQRLGKWSVHLPRDAEVMADVSVI